MNIKEIKEMINLMNENDLTELEIEKDDMRIKFKKGSSGGFEAISSPIIIEKEKSQLQAPPATPQATEAIPTKTVEIKSPMVGTFYRAPSPEAPPFVEVGDVVDIGAVVCIIEAMKLMNEIKSEVRGKIVEVLIQNAEPIEFGQPLFVLEPL